MSTTFARTAGILAATAAVAVGTIAAAVPAEATGTIINAPRLSVVCTAPHHGLYYSEVRFRQGGHWAGGASVVVTLSYANAEHAKVEMHTKAGPHGWFKVRRTLHSDNTGPWVSGTTYTWTTALYKQTAATARRGTVKLVNGC